MKKILLLLVLLIPACATQSLATYGMPKAPKVGPREYVEGWKAGCQTGMTAYSSDYLRSRYSANVDGNRMADPVYNKGWELGLSYCQYYASTYLSNPEFNKSDIRNNNTWVSMESDGFFSYKGIDKVDWVPFAANEYTE